MTTIQAAEFRKNMDSYMRLASRGEKIRVTYRGKPAIVISADEVAEESNFEAIMAAVDKIHAGLSPDARKRMSELTDEDVERIRHEHMKEKYGI